jgi:carotenoid cleavage dioxygenase-like enzyme
MLDKASFPYGAGFRSLTIEIAEPVALPVRGALPSWLKGALLRTGPSKFEVVPAPIITGSTDWRCCIASPSWAGA